MRFYTLLLLALLAVACGKDGGETSEQNNSQTETIPTATDNATTSGSTNGSSTTTTNNSTYDPTTATAPPVSSDQVEEMSVHPTNIPGLIRAQADYSAGGQAMIGYVAFPEGDIGQRPGVLVIHEWWGHNSYARSRADMLAELGYVAMAVDMYGDGKQAAHPDDAGGFAMAVMGDPELAKTRFGAALNVLKNYPFVDANRIGVVGYCFGGSVALSMANAGYDLDAVAAFHSGLTLPIWPENENSVKAKVLVCNGADDTFISADDISTFKSNMDGAAVDYEYIAYPGAVHAFTDPGADAKGAEFELPLAYNKDADKASWAELQELLSTAFAQ